MKVKNLIVLLSSVALLGVTSPVHQVFANEATVATQEVGINEFEVIEVSKEHIITEYATENNISIEEATMILFPRKRMARSVEDETSYVIFRAAAQYTTRTQNLPNGAGQVYFYCQVSTSGGFRGIHRIIYAGYNAGNLVFNGNFQYHLADPNRIHYTLSGGLYSNTTYTVTGNVGAGVGGVVNANVSVSSTSSFVKSLYYHGDVGY
ncbi:TPA: hypothetical protein ACGO0I_000427 [Streptococcus suis]